eukprot:Sdes_comp19692_c0_seq1m11597
MEENTSKQEPSNTPENEILVRQGGRVKNFVEYGINILSSCEKATLLVKGSGKGLYKAITVSEIIKSSLYSKKFKSSSIIAYCTSEKKLTPQNMSSLLPKSIQKKDDTLNLNSQKNLSPKPSRFLLRQRHQEKFPPLKFI